MRQTNAAGHLVAKGFARDAAKLGAFSDSLRKAVTTDNFELTDGMLYVRKNVGGASNTVNIINSQTEVRVGYTNIDKGVLPPGKAFIILGVAFGYQTGDIASVDEGSVVYNKLAHPALLNSEIEFTQKGRYILEKGIPAKMLFNTGTEQKSDDNVYWLRNLAVINDAQSFELKQLFPDEVSMPANAAGANGNHFAEYAFIGVWVNQG